MAEHNELGRIGEEEALLYLTEKGYRLLDHNWRCGHLEIDIVADWWGEIVFVEVKTRRNERFATAEAAVDLKKKRNLIEAAHMWLKMNEREQFPFRYDIVTVVGEAQPFAIKHIQNAYTESRVRTERRRYRDEFSV